MALTKITANIIEDGAISTASLANTSITADKLAATLDLTGKTITVATATAGDNDTTVASTAFVSTAIANLADSAPETLNTLNELAAALGDDANFSTTVTNSIALKAPLASPDFTGDATFDTSTLVIDSTNNRVGIGTASPSQPLTVSKAGDLYIQVNNSSAGFNTYLGTYTNESRIVCDGAKPIAFFVNGSRVVDFANGGNVGIGTDNPTGGKLHVVGDVFAEGGSFYVGANGVVASDSTSRDLNFAIGNTTPKMTLDTSGNVGIGANNPGSILDIRKTNSGGVGPTLSLINGASVANGNAVDINMAGNPGGGALAPTGRIRLTENASAIPTLGFHLYDGSALGERMSLHQNGSTTLKLSNYASMLRLASGAGAVFGHNVEGGSNANEIVQSNTGYYGSFIKMYYNSGMAFHTMSSSGTAGDVVDSPSVTGTERMRITSNGAIKMPSSVFSQTDKYHLFTNDQGGEFVQILEHQNTSAADGSGPNGMQISFTGVAPNQTNRFFFRCGDTTALRIIIDSQGNITNQNGSYGQISDEKLKENIVDASPKLDELMQLEIKNFNFIGDDKKQLGVIAQQVETIFPNLIDERKDTHPTTNEDLGTTTKSVKYSVFVPMLIKAMQEQQTIIEDLKARIETLENP
jgi:hypothetical protein